MDKAPKHSTPGKVAYIWRFERYQIVAIKLKGLKFIFLVIVSLPSSSLLKISFVRRWLACTGPCFKGYLPPPARNCRLESDDLLSGTISIGAVVRGRTLHQCDPFQVQHFWRQFSYVFPWCSGSSTSIPTYTLAKNNQLNRKTLTLAK